MSFGFSIGDMVLCAQIAHRLFSSVTDGRKKAPRDLQELEDALFGLCYVLDLLQINHKALMENAASTPGVVMEHMNLHLEYLIRSCQETLTELDDVTATYREAANHLPQTTLRAQVRIQWKRILWDLRGDSLTKYREKLQFHTASINILLSTFIWSVPRLSGLFEI